MSSCADVFIELLSTKNKLLSADTWMMWMEHTKVQTFYIFQLFTHRRLNLSALVSKNADQPWDVELTDDRRRRFKKRNIAEKVNGTCKQVPTVNKDFICCETTQQKTFGLLRIVNTYVWRIAATKPWVHRTDNLNIGPCMDISATL
ncbi:hypothetical protein DPMN_096610 [Dreissena polymorpha]|uniref:Uncharacterized protein n=1 Tax=Dreissena polymorpha TaxID=45954 RepID=A0A9D4R3T8_DREPO|nr:hypothetical protein DPMN_096610 [Dreissena polymorpha]